MNTAAATATATRNAKGILVTFPDGDTLQVNGKAALRAEAVLVQHIHGRWFMGGCRADATKADAEARNSMVEKIGKRTGMVERLACDDAAAIRVTD